MSSPESVATDKYQCKRLYNFIYTESCGGVVIDLSNKIIQYLSEKASYTRADELALRFSVSVKTIYRTIKKINADKEVIESQRGLGYRIKNISEIVNRVGGFIDSSDLGDRYKSLLIRLLMRQPKKLGVRRLMSEYFVSESVFVNDLSRIREYLFRYSLNVIRTRGYIYVAGNEENIRKALNSIFLEEGRLIQSNSNIFDAIFPKISGKDRDFVSSQINFIEKELNLNILDPYRINIFSHLYILIRRTREGATILEALENDSEKDIKLIGHNVAFYRISLRVIKNIEDYLHMAVSKIESLYLLKYLVSTRFDKDLIENDSEDPLITEFANFIAISYPFDSSIRVNLVELSSDLVGHVKPMMNRLYSGIDMVNPLLDDVKFTYGNIFKNIDKIVKRFSIAHRLPKISDDEIGFLVLYVAKAIEVSHSHKKVILMCASGIGTAQLLKVKVTNAFPSLDIVDVISSYSFEKHPENYQMVDLIISTISVNNKKKIPIVLVSALFNEADKQRIEKLIKSD